MRKLEPLEEFVDRAKFFGQTWTTWRELAVTVSATRLSATAREEILAFLKRHGVRALGRREEDIDRRFRLLARPVKRPRRMLNIDEIVDSVLAESPRATRQARKAAKILEAHDRPVDVSLCCSWGAVSEDLVGTGRWKGRRYLLRRTTVFSEAIAIGTRGMDPHILAQLLRKKPLAELEQSDFGPLEIVADAIAVWRDNHVLFSPWISRAAPGVPSLEQLVKKLQAQKAELRFEPGSISGINAYTSRGENIAWT